MATIVRMTKDLSPWRKGQDAVIASDAFAVALVKSGDAEDPRPFPPPDVAPIVHERTASAPQRPLLKLGRKRGLT